MLAPLVLTVLTAAEPPPVSVLVASKRAGADAFAAKLAAKVHGQLVTSMPGAQDDATAAKLVKKAGGDAKACQGATECLGKTAALLGPGAVVVGVDVGKIAKTLAVHIEAVAADGKEPLAVADFSAPADKWADAAAEPLAAFVKQLTDKLAEPPATAKLDDIKRPEDSPEQANLEPPPTPAPAPVTTTTASRSSGGVKILPIAVLAGAAAALIASGVMLGLGMSEKGIVDGSLGNGGLTSELTEADFNRHRSQGNLFFTISLSTALVGLVLGAAGGALFAL